MFVLINITEFPKKNLYRHSDSHYPYTTFIIVSFRRINNIMQTSGCKISKLRSYGYTFNYCNLFCIFHTNTALKFFSVSF